MALDTQTTLLSTLPLRTHAEPIPWSHSDQGGKGEPASLPQGQARLSLDSGASCLAARHPVDAILTTTMSMC